MSQTSALKILSGWVAAASVQKFGGWQGAGRGLSIGKVLTWPRQVWGAGNDFRDRQFGLLGRWCSLCGWLPLRGVGLVYVTQHHVSLSEDGQDFSPFGGVEPNP